MQHQLPSLPYPMDALAPAISSETLEYHWGKHHRTYVDNLNKLIVNTKFENMSLEDIVRNSDSSIFNNSAQVWNHTFYWNCLVPISKRKYDRPQGKLADAINKSFGNWDKFHEKFTQTALTTFGSGWAWLVKNSSNGELEIISTPNAVTPLTDKQKTPLLTCDVWEHAYYIDYRNARAKHIEAYWSIVNFEFVQSNFEKA